MKPDWIHQGCISTGNWEPLPFRLRTWGNVTEFTTDLEQCYEDEHSEETVLSFKQAGVNLIIAHFYKGYGLGAEAEDIRLAKQLAGHCRTHDVRVGAYVQWRTYIPETLLPEEPQCESWAVVDSLGHKVLPYGSKQSYRWAPCPNNPDYLRYLKKVIRECVSTLHPAMIHLDNFNNGRTNVTCHCPFCQEKFIAFLRNKYDNAAFKGIFGWGHEVTPRMPDIRQPVHEVFARRITDPIVRALIEFREVALSETLSEVIEYGRSLDADLAFEVNPGGLNGVNVHVTSGLDHAKLLDKVVAFWDEERCDPGIYPSGALVSKFRSYKLTRNYDVLQFSYGRSRNNSERTQKKWLAESLAFSRNACFFSDRTDPIMDGELAEIRDFLLAHRQTYANRTPVSDLAAVRVRSSLAPSLGREWACQMLAEQYLFEKGHAFDILFDCQIDRLSAYKAIVLCGATSLTKEFEEAIASYVEAGGGLVLIDEVGTRDGRLRQHGTGLRERLIQRGARKQANGVLTLGKGPIASVDCIDTSDYPREEVFTTTAVYYDSWLIPENSAQIDAALEQATPGGFTFRPHFRRGVMCEYYRKDGEYQVHVFDLSDEKGLKGTLEFRPPGGLAKEARFVARTGDFPCDLVDKGQGLFEVHVEDKNFDTYGMVLIGT